jgi:Arabinose efflux permease
LKSLAKKLNGNRIWTKDFTFLIISLLLISCANYYFASSMAIYAKIISDSGTYAGLITASFYVGSVGMRLVNGTLVQKHGTHKLMLISAVLCLAACFAHNFAGIIIVLLLFRVLHGAGYSIFSTASGTAASYMVPKNRIGEGMGYFTLGNVLAMAVDPSIALAIVFQNTLSQFHYFFDTALPEKETIWI